MTFFWQNPSGSARKGAADFFYEHAGYSYPSGANKRQQEASRREGARRLAQAEAEASNRGWTVEWELEEGPWEDYLGEGQTLDDIDEVVWARLVDENGETLESLGGIQTGHDSAQNRSYRRVVEAELALEALLEKGLMPKRKR